MVGANCVETRRSVCREAFRTSPARAAAIVTRPCYGSGLRGGLGYRCFGWHGLKRIRIETPGQDGEDAGSTQKIGVPPGYSLQRLQSGLPSLLGAELSCRTRYHA